MEVVVLELARREEVELGIKTAAKKYNIKARYLTPTITSFSSGPLEEVIPKWQINTIREIIEQGIKAFALPILHPQPLIPVIKEAIDKGVGCISYDIDGPQTDRYFYVGTNNYLAAKIAGNKMATLLGFKGEVIIDSISLTSQSCKDRIAGFQESMKRYPEIKTEVVSVDEDLNKLYSLPQKIISSHPQISGIFSTTGLSAGVYAQSVKMAAKKEKIKMVCFDLDKDIVRYMQEGIIDLVIVQRLYSMGYKVVEYLYKIITQGKDLLLKSIPATKLVDTGVDIVTNENLEAYKKEQESLGVSFKF